MASFDLLGPVQKEREAVTIDKGEWSKNAEFVVENGLKEIEEFVSKWTLDEQWLFCIGNSFSFTLFIRLRQDILILEQTLDTYNTGSN